MVLFGKTGIGRNKVMKALLGGGGGGEFFKVIMVR